METPIQDITKYNSHMEKSLIDKIFFMDKVEADVFIDFGCADGSMIFMLQKMFPQHTFIGYDRSQEMIDLAWNKHAELGLSDSVRFTDNLEELNKSIRHYRIADKTICLTMFSLIHEVYSYGLSEVQDFWKTIWGLDIDYIAIRDMCVSQTASRPADSISVARVRQLYDPVKISQWESLWGAIDENWSLTHFLLTYQYEHNWEREYKENYLPLSKEKLLNLIPADYLIDFVEHYTLPYLRRKIEKDFGVQLQERTHLKLILRKV